METLKDQLEYHLKEFTDARYNKNGSKKAMYHAHIIKRLMQEKSELKNSQP